jgi:amino acid adenylation domain-containing protein
MSYAELAAAAGRLGAALRARGARPESRVAVFLPRSPAAVISFLAVAGSGAAYVPLDPSHPAKRIRDLLADARASYVITTPALRGLLPAHAAEVLEIPGTSAVEIAGAPVPASAPAGMGYQPDPPPGSLAYTIFTSGSTGRPKPVEVSNENLSAYLDSIMPALGLRPADRVLAFAATTFDAITEELYPALLCGASVALRPEEVRVPDAAFDALLAATQPTVLSLPVTFWHAWVDRLARDGGRVPGHLRMLLLNAEEPSVHRYRLWCAAGGAAVRLINTYGPTEATVTASLYEPGPATTAHELWGRFPVGTVLDGMTAHVLDPNGWPVPEGAVGELCLGGPAVTRGYGGQPGLTAAAYWPDQWAAKPGGRLYRTGDLARRLGDGTLLLLGRADHQVKIRGHRVELGEVEAALLAYPAVAQAAVLAIGDGELRQLVGYVAAAGPELTEARLRGYLIERLPPVMIPSRLLILPDLPLTPNRKVDRRSLVARLDSDLTAGPPGDGQVAVPPATPEQHALHRIWCAVLSRSSVSVYDNFFGIGGDSIRGLQIVTQARQAGLDLTAGDLFDRQTIAGLAELAAARPAVDPAVGTGQPSQRPPAAEADRAAVAGTAAPATGLTDIQLRGALARLRKD